MDMPGAEFSLGFIYTNQLDRGQLCSKIPGGLLQQLCPTLRSDGRGEPDRQPG